MHYNWVMTDGVSCYVSHFAPIDQSIRLVPNDQTTNVASLKYYPTGPRYSQLLYSEKSRAKGDSSLKHTHPVKPMPVKCDQVHPLDITLPNTVVEALETHRQQFIRYRAARCNLYGDANTKELQAGIVEILAREVLDDILLSCCKEVDLIIREIAAASVSRGV